ncbi:winged helix-turn-helix transcriptional regulator, partial [Zwartia sp.]|uniref:Lrp/AsnC family transcriptional regulator n=1 Tax=Zwartia sp. TaxID=2978004 RepID=UPI0027244533
MHDRSPSENMMNHDRGCIREIICYLSEKYVNIRNNFYKIFQNRKNMPIDKKDREILRLMQEDASLSLAELAHAVNLTPTPCWRRIQKLQEEGVIKKQVAICDARKLNLGLTTFV